MGLYVLELATRWVLAPLARPPARVHPGVLGCLAGARLAVVAIVLLLGMSWMLGGGCTSSTSQSGTQPSDQPPRKLVLDLGNRVTMKFVLIPAGKFMMGSPDSEAGRENDEGPQHEVTITRPFYMGIYEVTQKQYQQIMGTNPSSREHRGPGKPVEFVWWDQATEFCRKLSQRTGRNVHLPTEAQWEYACRAGSGTAFNTGQTITRWQANVDAPPWGSTKSVGRYKSNAWGLYDMHGNVCEWCSDRYGKDYYSKSPQADPQGPASGTFHVVRGGYYANLLPQCRSARRFGSGPDNYDGPPGFRVVVELK